MNLFDDFLQKYPPTGQLQKPSEEVLNQFRNRLPAELLEFWQAYGFGNYGNGLLKVIDPNDYADYFYVWLGGENPTRIPIMLTGFGNILYYRKLTDSVSDIALLDIHHRCTDVCAYSFGEFIQLLTDDEAAGPLLDKTLLARLLRNAVHLPATKSSSLCRHWHWGEASQSLRSTRAMQWCISACFSTC